MSSGERKRSKEAIPASTCRLLLVRHATSEGSGRFQGHQDVPLTRAGRRELRFLWQKCSPYPVRSVYSSDLRRARQTAEDLARRFGLEVQVRPELREIHFGRWEGLTWDEIARQDPHLASLWMKRFPYQPIPGGERLWQFTKRITAVVSEIVDVNRGRCALLVTHAGVIRATLGKVLGLPAPNLCRLAQDSCALNIIDFMDGGAVVRCING